MRILTKYVLKEHAGPFLFALSAATSLLLLNYIAKKLSDLAGKGLEWTVIAEFLLLSLPFTIAMTLPMAVLAATLYAFSRLASENEIAAMKANGVSMGSLLFPVGVAAVILSIVMVVFNDQVLPRANHRLATLMQDIARKKPTFALREQVLNDVIPGRGINLRMSTISRAETDILHDVHIYDMTHPQAVRTIHADSGKIHLTIDQRDIVLTLYNGYVVDISRKDPGSLNRVYFTENRMRIEGVGNELNRVTRESTKGEREQSVCDMDMNYQKARREYAATRSELQQRMLHLVREAVRGGDVIFAAEEPGAYTPERTWGSIYCDGVRAVEKTVFGLTPSADSAARVDSVQRAMDSTIAAHMAATGSAGDSGLMLSGTTPLIDSLVQAQDTATLTYGFGRLSDFAESVGSDIQNIQLRLRLSRGTMSSFAVEIHKKFSLAAACLVFVLIGVPFALRFPKGGIGMVLSTSLVIFAISYVGLIGGEALADGLTVSPFIAMWLANFLLTIVGIALILRMGRESMSRGGAFAGVLDDIRAWFDRKRGRSTS